MRLTIIFPRRLRVALSLFVGMTVLCSFGLLYAFEDLTQPGESLLVLKSGKVVAGEVKPVAGGYMLKRPSGDVLVPFDIVQFEAKSLRDAYQKHLELLKPEERTATARILLARWCLSQQLYEEAETELKEAIKLEPRRTEPRLLLKKLRDNILDPVTTETFTDADDEELMGTVVLADGTTHRIQSLAGLSRETALAYTRTIEPILMNKCSNASCHGQAADNNFQLEYIPLGQGVHRTQSERNLAAVLEFIDVQNPRNSPLLTEIANGHGPDGVSLFLGSVGARQHKAFREWVVGIAREKKKTSRTFTELVDNSNNDNRSGTDALHEANDRSKRDDDLTPPELLPDPFNPDVFNRQYHGREVRSAVFETSPIDTLPSPMPNRTRLRVR